MTQNKKNTESITYQVLNHECQLVFTLCNQSENKYPLYDLEIIIDGFDTLELWQQINGEKSTHLKLSDIRPIAKKTIKILNQWCNNHPETFLSFYCGLATAHLTFCRIYWKLGFICDGRVETFVTFINKEGKRTSYIGMLNLLTKNDLWFTNDLWRVAKDTDFFLGELYTPVDMFHDLLKDNGVNVIQTSYKKPPFLEQG